MGCVCLEKKYEGPHRDGQGAAVAIKMKQGCKKIGSFGDYGESSNPLEIST